MIYSLWEYKLKLKLWTKRFFIKPIKCSHRGTLKKFTSKIWLRENKWLWSHRADGGLLVAELLSVSSHHVFDFQLLHDLLLLQVGVLLLSDGASQLLGVRLCQTGFQPRCQWFPVRGTESNEELLSSSLIKWLKLEKSLNYKNPFCYYANQKTDYQ